MMLLVAICFATYAFVAVFIICDLGQRLTDAFEEDRDELLTFDWYLFPLEIRRLLPNILIGTQQPVVLDCFGSICVLRSTFNEVS